VYVRERERERLEVGRTVHVCVFLNMSCVCVFVVELPWPLEQLAS